MSPIRRVKGAKGGSSRLFNKSNGILLLGGGLLVLLSFLERRPQPGDDELIRSVPSSEIERMRQAADEETSERRALDIQRKLSDISSVAALQELKSPQNSAYAWIVDDDDRQLRADDPQLIQRYVLSLLWFSLNGSEWKQQSSSYWMTEMHECDWKINEGGIRLGVLNCDEDKEALKLHLAGNNLRGSLPEEIRHLSLLSYLDLQKNDLTGRIPDQLGYLTTLEYLGLSGNQLEGDLPRMLGGIDNLEQLLLQGNKLVGSVPQSLCKLMKHGRFYNLWSDCNGSIECDCCTVCCTSGTKCGPKKKAG